MQNSDPRDPVDIETFTWDLLIDMKNVSAGLRARNATKFQVEIRICQNVRLEGMKDVWPDILLCYQIRLNIFQ